jgi:hypothetical protein
MFKEPRRLTSCAWARGNFRARGAHRGTFFSLSLAHENLLETGSKGRVNDLISKQPFFDLVQITQ